MGVAEPEGCQRSATPAGTRAVVQRRLTALHGFVSLALPPCREFGRAQPRPAPARRRERRVRCGSREPRSICPCFSPAHQAPVALPRPNPRAAASGHFEMTQAPAVARRPRAGARARAPRGTLRSRKRVRPVLHMHIRLRYLLVFTHLNFPLTSRARTAHRCPLQKTLDGQIYFPTRNKPEQVVAELQSVTRAGAANGAMGVLSRGVFCDGLRRGGVCPGPVEDIRPTAWHTPVVCSRLQAGENAGGGRRCGRS
jgi:hypothetical protein